MESKTSLYNKMIVKKNLTRLWPLWVIPTILLQVSSMLLLLSNYSYTKAQVKEQLCIQVARNLSGTSMLFSVALLAICCAVLVFQYLNRSTSAFMMHSFPLTRKCLFISHAFSGYVMLLIPYLLLYIAIGIFCLIAHVPMGLALLSYFLETLFAATFFYGVAVLLTMFSGNSIMSIVMYSVTQGIVYGADSLLRSVTDYFIFGTHEYSSTQGIDRIVRWMTPLLKMNGIFRSQYVAEDSFARETDMTAASLNHFFAPQIARFALYLIPAALCFFLALQLYKKRKMERVGETLVFPWSKVIFRFVFCFCASLIFVVVVYWLGFALLATNLTYDTFYLCGLVLLVAGTIVSYIVCDMILEKTWHIFKNLSWHMILLFCLVIGSVFVGEHYLMLHRNQVAKGQIEKIRITVDKGHAATIEKTDEIGQIIDFENALNDQARKQSIGTLQKGSTYVSITYYYKNGGNGAHSYEFVWKDNKAASMKLLDLLNKKEGAAKRYGLGNSDAGKLRDFYIVEGKNEESYQIPTQYQAEAYDALLADLDAGRIVIADFYDPENKAADTSGVFQKNKTEWCLSFCRPYRKNAQLSQEVEEYDDYYIEVTKEAAALNQWYEKRNGDILRYNEIMTTE